MHMPKFSLMLTVAINADIKDVQFDSFEPHKVLFLTGLGCQQGDVGEPISVNMFVAKSFG